MPRSRTRAKGDGLPFVDIAADGGDHLIFVTKSGNYDFDCAPFRSGQEWLDRYVAPDPFHKLDEVSSQRCAQAKTMPKG